MVFICHTLIRLCNATSSQSHQSGSLYYFNKCSTIIFAFFCIWKSFLFNLFWEPRIRTDRQSDLLGCCGTSGIVCGVLTLAMSVCACVCTLLYGSLLIIKLAYLTLVIIGLHFAVFALDVCILWPWLYGPLIVLGLRSLHVQSEIFVCVFLYLALICTL